MFVIVARAGVGFPCGYSATTRVRAYAQVLRDAGVEVCVVVVDPSERAGDRSGNTEASGTWEGVRFLYACGTIMRPTSRTMRLILRAWGTLGTWKAIGSWRHSGRLEGVLLYSETLPLTLGCKIASGSRGPLLLDKDELPSIHRSKGRLARALEPLYVRSVYRLFDGIVTVSEPLQRVLSPWLARHTWQVVVPASIDTREFAAVPPTPVQKGRYIAYAGTLNETKDGVVTLVEAFGSLAKMHPDVDLVLIGGASSDDRVRVDRAVAVLHLEDRVRFAGVMRREAMIGALKAADVLVIARPDSPQARTGFPTKLVEYLACGVATVATEVGDAGRALRGTGAAMLVPCGDRKGLADAISELLADDQKREMLGRRAADVASDVFDSGVALRPFLERVFGKTG